MDLCSLAKQYRVDKCPEVALHSYTPAYHNILNNRRDMIKLVLEIGIGNMSITSPLVGSSYKPGASLRMWRDYFPNAQILGCDILESVLFEEERIKTIYTDQSDPKSLQNLANYTKTFDKYVDLIVDDGSHVIEHMMLSFQILWERIRPGGLYIIEDIRARNLEYFKKAAEIFNFTDATLVYSHIGKNDWDAFVVFKKVKVYDTREEMLLACVPKGGVYAEIGVFEGEFSAFLLNSLEPSQLYLMDLFQGHCGSGNQDGNFFKMLDLNRSFQDLNKKYAEDKRVRIQRGNSRDLLSDLDDNSLDMIYIDGDHGYEGCKSDLELAYKKCKSGGWICGHDYEMNMAKAQTVYTFGVQRAVDEFCLKYKQTIAAKGRDGCVSYAIHLLKLI